MSDKSILDDFLKRAHLKACGSNNVTDCGEECAYMKDVAFSELGRLTAHLERVEAALRPFAEIGRQFAGKEFGNVVPVPILDLMNAAAALDTTRETK